MNAPLPNPFRGKIPKRREIEGIRPITREDLPRLLGPRDNSASIPQRLRESHHDIARLLATGLDLARIAAITGYSTNRVWQLSQSPAMVNLVAHYRSHLDTTFLAAAEPYYDLATRNMLAAERHLADRIAELDEDGELLSVREALAISRDAADRFGYSKRQTNLNVNADFAALLEKAIERSGKGPIIDGTPASSLDAPRRPPGATVAQPQAAPLRRLA